MPKNADEEEQIGELPSSTVTQALQVIYRYSRQPVLRSSAMRVMPPSRVLISLLICLRACFAAAQSDIAPIFQPAPRPAPTSLRLASDLRLETHFAPLTPGGVGLLRLSGGGIKRARADFHGAVFSFFPADDGVYYALIAVDMNTHPRAYPLIVTAERASGDVVFEVPLRIEPGAFITQNLVLPGNRVYLTDPAIEYDELARLSALTALVSPAPLWDASGFELPHDSALTTPFGAFRTLNEGRESRHTGWDQNLPTGSPVRAMASGEARFAGMLDIRGNYALIDHGLGIYSGYAHLSELHVEAGQRVEAGQIIGLSGNTGRSSAPHLHWEIAIRGKWVDGSAFLELWLPAPGGASGAANRRQ